MKFQPEDFDKIRSKKLAVAIRRLNSDKPLTAAQERLLAEEEANVRSGNADLQTPGIPAPAGGGFVKGWDALAIILGVSTRALKDWRADPRYTDWPRPKDNGNRHDVAAWREFMVRHRLKRGKALAEVEIDPENAGDDAGQGIIQPPRVAGSQAQWNVAIAALDHRKKENTIREQEEALLVAAELETPLGALLAALQTKLSQFPDRVARFVTGLRDVQEVSDRLRDEIDADLSDLHGARYLNLTVGELVAALPFDARSEELFKLVVFDGQDRGHLLELIAHVALAALAQIGRKTLAQVRTRETISDEDLSDSATGQVTDEAASSEHARRANVSADVEAPPAGSEKALQNTPSSTSTRRAASGAKPRQTRASKAKWKPSRKPHAKPATPPRDVEPVKRQAFTKRRSRR